MPVDLVPDLAKALSDAGQKIGSRADLMVYLDGNTKVGDTVEVTAVRDGRTGNMKARLAETPQQ